MIRRMRESDLEGAARLEKRYFSVPWTREQLGESLQSGVAFTMAKWSLLCQSTIFLQVFYSPFFRAFWGAADAPKELWPPGFSSVFFTIAYHDCSRRRPEPETRF